MVRDFDVGLSKLAGADLRLMEARARPLIVHTLKRLTNDDLFEFNPLPWKRGPHGAWVLYRRWYWIYLAQWNAGEPELWQIGLGRGSLRVEGIARKEDGESMLRRFRPT